MKPYTLSEFLINTGVRNEVITDTQTIIGYRWSLMTPRFIPRVATMNENSPI